MIREAREAAPREFVPRLAELERRLLSGVERRPAATLALAALAGFTLGFLPSRWTRAALALGARALVPLAVSQLDGALYADPSSDSQRRTP